MIVIFSFFLVGGPKQRVQLQKQEEEMIMKREKNGKISMKRKMRNPQYQGRKQQIYPVLCVWLDR